MSLCLDFAAIPEPKEVSPARPLSVAILCDLAEENWPSMDLVGEMLYSRLRNEHRHMFSATRIQPILPSGFRRTPLTLQRVFGRFLHYPTEARRIRRQYDIFHIVDHSYAHLVHELPPHRTIVTCHDLDAFRCLLAGASEKRSFAFRSMTRRILSGLRMAAHVTCDTAATSDDILHHKLVSPRRLSVVHNGVHPAFGPRADRQADEELSRLLGRTPAASPEILHVGSVVPRKRIDLLLQVFAQVSEVSPKLRLLRAGGELTRIQQALAHALGIQDRIDVLPYLSPPLLAAAYRRAALLMQTSDSEGFGLPVVESLACGTPVVASDIPALREVGGSAAKYCAVGDIPAWTNSVIARLAGHKDRDALVRRAQSFTWSNYAARMTRIYEGILSR